MDRSLFTAKFKRDYVAYSAIAIFFLIVISEVALAVAIPVFLIRSDLWAQRIQRQQMVTTYDNLRNRIDRMKVKDKDALAEINLIGWNLNLMADFLRRNRQTMPHEQVIAISEDLAAMQTVLGKLAAKDAPYNRENKLSADAYLQQLSNEIAAGKANTGDKASNGKNSTAEYNR